MPNRNDEVLDLILRHEGGYVNDPDDPGGVTNMGITLKSFQEWMDGRGLTGFIATPEMIKELNPADAKTFYGEQYLSKFDWVADDCLFQLLCDTAVLHGRGRTSIWLQRAVGALEDGVLGPKTREAVKNAAPRRVYQALLRLRINNYGVLVSQNSKLVKFLPGWLRRTTEMLECA